MPRNARQEGQSTVELALCLPVIAFLVAAVIEIGMLSADRARVWHSAREGARAASVTSEQSVIEDAAAANGLDDLDVEVAPGPSFRVQGDPITVDVAYRPHGHLPIVGSLFSNVVLRGTATMRIEQP